MRTYRHPTGMPLARRVRLLGWALPAPDGALTVARWRRRLWGHAIAAVAATAVGSPFGVLILAAAVPTGWRVARGGVAVMLLRRDDRRYLRMRRRLPTRDLRM